MLIIFKNPQRAGVKNGQPAGSAAKGNIIQNIKAD